MYSQAHFVKQKRKHLVLGAPKNTTEVFTIYSCNYKYYDLSDFRSIWLEIFSKSGDKILI